MWIVMVCVAVIILLPIVVSAAAAVYGFTSNACWHDWVVIDYKRESDIRYEVDVVSSIGGTPRRLPYSSFSSENYYETRVCLKCAVIDDQIAVIKERLAAEIREERSRKAKAEEIMAASKPAPKQRQKQPPGPPQSLVQRIRAARSAECTNTTPPSSE